MPHLGLDDAGLPVLFADVPNSGVATVASNTKGNASHDTHSGKFAAGAKPPDAAPDAPPASDQPNTSPIEYKRMLDAVRDAAREMDLPAEGDIKSFLKGRAKNPGQVDVTEFLNLVKEQKISDLVDIIDQQMRNTVPGSMSGKRVVKVVSPKGYARRAFASLTNEGVAELMHRLEFKGHDQPEVEAFILGRKKPQTHDTIKQHRDALAASDEMDPGLWWGSYSDDVPLEDDEL